MIQETIVTTVDNMGKAHIAPMGIHVLEHKYLIMPFRPSTTLDNILQTRAAVINFCDDVRIFAGCLTGKRNWPLTDSKKITGKYLCQALAHKEVELVRVEDDYTRPKLYCKTVHSENHAPFTGFNRAQFAVLELAILVSRLGMLPWEKIQSEMDYLQIGFEKTKSDREQQAWDWLMQRIEQFKHEEQIS